ncbi:MAG: hypothetical protein K2J48_11375 [Muribaculaceae bacterium]|nr:hypothetical protein [Muribaculaceae bacterium]MDE6793669.1 hypothetical protein [Muribaculaceae bacterium]
MKEIQKSEQAAKEITHPEDNFKGYTLEEIRYQRALVALHKEFCKTKINRVSSQLTHSNPFSSSSSSLPGKVGFFAGKLLTGLNYMDYAMLGFNLFGSAKKIYSFFKKKK